jgi:hypothetical protein
MGSRLGVSVMGTPGRHEPAPRSAGAEPLHRLRATSLWLSAGLLEFCRPAAPGAEGGHARWQHPGPDPVAPLLEPGGLGYGQVTRGMGLAANGAEHWCAFKTPAAGQVVAGQ